MSTEQKNSIVALKDSASEIQAILSLHNKSDLATLAAIEISYLEAISQTKPIIKSCEAISVLLAVKSVLKKNLTLDPHANLVYIKTRNINTAAKGQTAVWKTILEIEPTANGALSYARQCGRILDAKRPVVEYNGEKKAVKVTVSIQVPGVPSPRWEDFTFTEEEDFYRWRRASHKENARGYYNLTQEKKEGKLVPDDQTHNYANENYFNFNGGPDPEFLRAKALKHALKKLGTNQNELQPGNFIKVENIQLIEPSKDTEASSESDTENVNYTEVQDKFDANKL